MSRYDLDRDEIAELLADLPRYRAVQLWEGLYPRLADPTELTRPAAGAPGAVVVDTALAPALSASNTSSSPTPGRRSNGSSPLPTGTRSRPS